MNFFDAQDNARRITRRLVGFYLLATLIIVTGVAVIAGLALWNPARSGVPLGVEALLRQQGGTMLAAAVLAVLVILGATFYKTAVLSSGGGRVARDLGGTPVAPDVTDPLRRRLRNVVEEMAIASGVPVPEIYVLEAESGINAFAAGYTPGDAAVAVTRGALELLSRDELQGVIAHEFSHILNGDMRLNIRLMGVLFGIMVLGLVGRLILRGSHHGRLVRSRDRGAPVVLLIGLGLAVLGYTGVFLARLIKASVSRQREYLADASAVQFTRQTDGIANALKKIGGYHRGSYITRADPEEVAHMLFGTGAKLRGMFATHPPLVDRIRALEPSFDASQFPIIDPRDRTAAADEDGPDAHADGMTSAFAESGQRYVATDISDSVGRPEDEHVLYAAGIRRAMPADLYSAAHSPELAFLLAVALVLDQDGDNLDRQLMICTERLGNDRTRIVRGLYDSLALVGPEFRLPLLEVAFPALKNRPQPHLVFLVELCSRLIDVDGRIDLYEFCFLRILTVTLRQAGDPAGASRRHRAPKRQVREAAINLLRILANYGHADRAGRERAFAAGIATFPAWARDYTFDGAPALSVDLLNHSLDLLVTLNAAGRGLLLRAVSATAAADDEITVREAELIRAVCATLELPLPPILVHDRDEPGRATPAP
ncbi:MAG: M48 family metallopeptidase [Woeseiaceae bacterium]|nr:M48 family metallopeptidase [Woeseiaceae bacterium]